MLKIANEILHLRENPPENMAGSMARGIAESGTGIRITPTVHIQVATAKISARMKETASAEEEKETLTTEGSEKPGIDYVPIDPSVTFVFSSVNSSFMMS